MSGIISTAFLSRLREKAAIDDIVGNYVSLRRSGSDGLIGLCPFHDEKSPSFHVRPSQGYFHCFGCGEGGDAISFLQKQEQLSFVDAVERIAAQYGLTIEYDHTHAGNTGNAGRRSNYNEKARLIAANKSACEFYCNQLHSPQGKIAKEFLYDRGFSHECIHNFSCGYAPDGWNTLTEHLVSEGFTIKELEQAGLSRQTSKGNWVDRFRRRVVWPIKSMPGDVIGFGARKLFDDDEQGKYINTPETILYKKSQVLFGLDIARKAIASKRQVVIVEGYTDVMAMHAAGITTAVATCGTAFGEGHAKLLRRALLDDNDWQSEIIYTFDGDNAGKAAAVKAFTMDHLIVGQSFIAVAPQGLDPCDLRLHAGDSALVELIAQRVPLVEFILKKKIEEIEGLDITLTSTPEKRRQAVEAGAEVLAFIHDPLVRKDYAQQYANWIGLSSPKDILDQIKQHTQRKISSTTQSSPSHKSNKEIDYAQAYVNMIQKWNKDPALSLQKQLMQAVLQYPELVGRSFDALPIEWFTHPIMRALRTAISEPEGVEAALRQRQGNKREWLLTILERRNITAENSPQKPSDVSPSTTTAQAENDAINKKLITQLLGGLSVEPLAADQEHISQFVRDILIRCQEQWVGNQIAAVKIQLNRLRPEMDEYSTVWHDLAALEAYRRTLIEQIVST